MVLACVTSASMSTFTVSVEPPKAASSVSRSAVESPPEGRKSRVSKLVSMRVAAIPSSTVTMATTAR